MTAVVRTLRMPSSSQNPMRIVLTPLAEPGGPRVASRRVHVRQLGQVAHAHHHLGLGIPAADLEVSPQGRGEAEADRLDDRVDPEPDAPALEERHGLIQALERTGTI